MVHTEVVLQRDGGKGLCGCFNLDALLGFNSLVQAIAPATTLHDTTCLLIDDLDFAVFRDDVINVPVEHAECLEQLVHGMYTLSLGGVFGHYLVLALEFLFLRKALIMLDFGKFRTYVGEHEELGVFRTACQGIDTLVGQIDLLVLLLNGEIKRFQGHRHLLLVVLQVVSLGAQHLLLDTWFRQELDEGRVLWPCTVGTIELGSTFVLDVLVGVVHLLLGLVEQLVGQSLLQTNYVLHTVTVGLVKFLVGVFRSTWRRTGDDKRRTGIVDQHGVDLIDDGEIMFALYEVLGMSGHIVAQVVEAELVVGAECDVAVVGLATFVRIGLIAVDAIDGQAMELVEWSHPFAVTLGEVIVHGYNVYTIMSQGVQEDWQRSHKCLTFTSCHLGDLALVKHGAAEELNVIVNHIPACGVTACNPRGLVDGLVAVDGDKVTSGSQVAVHLGGCYLHSLVVGKTVGRVLDDGIHLGKVFGELCFLCLTYLLLEFVHFGPNGLTLLHLKVFDGVAKVLYLIFVGLHAGLQVLHDLLGAGTQLVIAEFFDGRVSSLDLLHPWLDEFHIAARLVAEDFL